MHKIQGKKSKYPDEFFLRLREVEKLVQQQRENATESAMEADSANKS